MRGLIYVLGLLLGGTVAAQESASYQITENSPNAGGHPHDGVVMTSAGYQISLDAIGQAVTPTRADSASFALASGFVSTFAPPGEITNLVFIDPFTLAWDPDGTVGDYAVYQGIITNPFDENFGTCIQPPPPLTTPMTVVTTMPAIGEAQFFS